MANKIILIPKTPNEAVKEALQHIEAERTGEQYGLYTRYNSLNIAMGKYFRFNNVNLWAGLSGHGKSYFMNIINSDFLDYGEGGINENIDFVPVILNFCFEMSAYNEILRSVAGDMGVSYGYLLSSQYDKKTKEYNTLTDAELIKVKEYLKYYSNKSMLFFETPGNIKVIYNTIEHVVESYSKKTRNDGKPYKFIINIDHTLLIDTLDEDSALELMANVGKTSIAVRKDFGAMVNLVGQLNNNIEDVRRITNASLHYPIKSDIYAQGQLYNACDSVFVTHQPQLLKITQYGSRKKDTKDLIHLIRLKARHGHTGNIWLKNNLKNGKIEEFPKVDENLEEINEYLEEM